MTHQDRNAADHLPESGKPGKAVDPFADPGLPAHEPRRQDIDELAARHSERVVTMFFLLAVVAAFAFIACYVLIPKSKVVFIFPWGHVMAQNFGLGGTLGIALLCIGVAAIHWARTLMSDVELPAERHPIEAPPAVRQQVFDDFRQGAYESGIGRRKMLRNAMLGALTIVPLSAIVLFRDLGPLPERKLESTAWANGKRLINMNNDQPLRPEDIAVGSLTFAKPEGVQESDANFQEVMAKAALMIVRIMPNNIKDKQSADWGHQGILAYSKICTHVGCPISLYEQQTHHVLCPCHQSTFDLADGGRVIFGPAGHPLPQLRIAVNGQGYLSALGDFDKPVGPGYWERSA
ncbi:Rieske 2Fe-2S domain-containing protein [Streptantibioticus rubrisoli]|uniref:Cytochrome bc1 complex Rieske iron-sulfur subunit n=1 Tax=Streptantibioticus rubrisoli TaxID=1387313 RepID=A0ABT1PAH0_9ACTN|nr:Rieske 2Fe-2S domain-containing protein [Streptantibioticus rubrisoli]MCQ4041325.1 Rieske (2Fe-2S) protein [Streptantibioticus rubrisoli]